MEANLLWFKFSVFSPSLVPDEHWRKLSLVKPSLICVVRLVGMQLGGSYKAGAYMICFCVVFRLFERTC